MSYLNSDNMALLYRLISVTLLLALGVQSSYAATPNFVIDSGNSKLEVFVSGASDAFKPEPFRNWIQHSADIVTRYYGDFPVPRARVDLDLFPGGGITGGTAYGEPMARVALTVGEYNEPADLARDWRLVHELIHLAFPMVSRRHHWLVEGLPTYLESVVRARAGDLDEAFVWKGFLRGMPHGLPTGAETGLDGTGRWGRIYWGGAMFVLYADMEIRRQTGGKKSIQDAVRALPRSGRNHETRSALRPLLEIADAATGTRVLQELYERAGDQRWDPDLEKLWQELGVVISDDQLNLDDAASKAKLRKALLAGDE